MEWSVERAMPCNSWTIDERKWTEYPSKEPTGRDKSLLLLLLLLMLLLRLLVVAVLVLIDLDGGDDVFLDGVTQFTSPHFLLEAFHVKGFTWVERILLERIEPVGRGLVVLAVRSAVARLYYWGECGKGGMWEGCVWGGGVEFKVSGVRRNQREQ